jgi:hypothetical protein
MDALAVLVSTGAGMIRAALDAQSSDPDIKTVWQARR